MCLRHGVVSDEHQANVGSENKMIILLCWELKSLRQHFIKVFPSKLGELPVGFFEEISFQVLDPKFYSAFSGVRYLNKYWKLSRVYFISVNGIALRTCYVICI